MYRALLLTLALIGCVRDKPLVDNDGDGFFADDNDCNDSDPRIHPGEPEVCNGLDDDCDLATDEGLDQYYWEDTDGDGYGNPDLPTAACEPPDGTVDNNDDCDDADEAINPGSVEVCNDVDDDCNGRIDDGALLTVYADTDGDGYGDPDAAEEACTVGDGQALSADDCDDGNDAIHPDAAELCDGLDQDCDGEADEDLGVTVYADADGDGYGDGSAPETACEAGAGQSANGDDCDDADPAIHPGADESDCTDPTDYNCDGSSSYTDADGDGFAACGDCDDSQAAISPDATESCNELDDDCDGATDEAGATGEATWYADADGDGYGGSSTTLACDAPSGYLATDDDCDDTRASVNPAGTETCNDLDDDCDSSVDEGLATTWYADTDGDGYGDSASTTSDCATPSGYVADATDCDDDTSAVHPGAPETDCTDPTDYDCDGVTTYADVDRDGWAACEDCDDTDRFTSPGATEACNAVDDDCDGDIDEAGATGEDTWYADTDGDGYGNASSTTTACDLPTGYVATSTDCDDGNAAISPADAETCNGIDDDCDGTADDGLSGTWYLDADGDSYGVSTTVSTACAMPSGYATASTDCNDSDSTISPADAEICDDHVDQDCDGTADDGCAVTYTHCGTISADETWSGGDIHVVTCDVIVQGSSAPWLTIEDDATVQFAPGAGLYIGYANYGGLEVEGTVYGVTFTSSSTHPTAGSWDGIWFGWGDRGSWLEGATVEYGGASGYGAITLSSADLVSIVNSSITDSSVHGVGVYSSTLEMYGSTASGNDSDGVYLDAYSALLDDRTATFTDNTLTDNGDYSIVLPVDSVGDLDASSSFTGNGETEIYVHAGTVSDDATWQDFDAPLLLTGDVYVASVLTIEDGSELRFDSGAGMFVGYWNYAELYVEGTTSGVTFTSAANRKRAGDWDGLHFSTYVEGAEIDGATIEYGGGNGAANVYITSTSYTDAIYFRNSTITDSAASGFYLYWGGVLDIDDSTVEDNEDYGLYVYDESSLNGDGSCEGNTFTSNDVGVSVPAADGGALMDDGTYAGNYSDDVQLRGDTITEDVTWRDLDVPWHVTGDVAVQGTTTPRLTIEDGTEVQFSANTGLTIGWSYYAELDIQGTTQGVLLTSDESSPAPGDWDGVFLTWNNQDSVLRGATIEYAGSNGYGGIYLNPSSYHNGTVEIDSCTITNSSNSGIYAYDSDYLWIHDTTVSDNADYGIYLSYSSLETTGEPTFTDNVITGNGDNPLLVEVTSLDQLDASSTFTGNGIDRIYVYSGTVAESGTWQDLDVPYEMHGDTWIQGVGTPVITVEAGTELLFDIYATIMIGPFTNGEMQAIGTATEPVVFTSSQDVPAPGDWDGLYLGYYDTGSVFDYVEVSYGGQQNSNVYFYANGTRGSVTNSTIAYSSGYGIYLGGGSDPTLSGNTYTGNAGASVYP